MNKNIKKILSLMVAFVFAMNIGVVSYANVPEKVNYTSNASYDEQEGEWLETVADILSVFDSVKDLWQNPSWVNAGFLLWDVGSVVAPGVPGSYVGKGAKEATEKMLKKGAKEAGEKALKNATKVFFKKGLMENVEKQMKSTFKNKKVVKNVKEAINRAIQKGPVKSEFGEEGIKKLKNGGIDGYMYELKFFFRDAGGKQIRTWRLLGDKVDGHYVFKKLKETHK